jgi:hypothetical protein
MKNRLASLPRNSLVCVVLALLPNCGGGSPAAQSAQGASAANQAPAGDAKPFDFEATIKREASGLKEQGVQGPDAAWSAKVPAAAEPKLSRAENVMLVDIPIGSESAVRCQIFADTLDPAGTLHGVIKESAEAVEYRSIAPSGVGLFGGLPAAFLETVYVTETEGGKGAGGLKLAIQVREQESLLCLHDELGYRQTFKDISNAFFSSFQVRNASPSASTYTEVSKVHLGETDVGYGVTRVTPGEKPGERMYSYSNTTLIPISPKDVVFNDAYELYAYDAKSALQTATWVDGSNGEIAMKVTIKRGAGAKYAYEGEAKGKPLKGVLEAPRGLGGPLDTAARLKKKLKAGGAFELVLPEYHPSLDLTTLVDVKYSHQKSDPARQVTVTLREHTITTELDEDGIAKASSFLIGKNKLTIERLKSSGHP